MKTTVNYKKLLETLKGQSVDRPNQRTAGTLSGHAAGEPFEKLVYKKLKEAYPNNIYKQYEYLNDLYKKNPQAISVEQRYNLINTPTALFLLNRGDSATREWSMQNIFEERQSDTADILFSKGNYYDLIDVKTRNIAKKSQPPNIISAYKLAQMCAIMLDNEEFDAVNINYVEIDWEERGNKLYCVDAHYASLFKAQPEQLYINWAAGLQIQFHVADIEQTWNGDVSAWAKHYIAHFVQSAEHRCQTMGDKFITPFLKYIE